jgi:hypothetical protein
MVSRGMVWRCGLITVEKACRNAYTQPKNDANESCGVAREDHRFPVAPKKSGRIRVSLLESLAARNAKRKNWNNESSSPVPKYFDNHLRNYFTDKLEYHKSS